MSVASIKGITQTSFNTTGLNGSFQLVNSGGFPFSIQVLRIVNDSNVSVTVSFDGVNAVTIVRAQSDWELQFFAYASNFYTAGFPKGMAIYVSGASGTGLIYVSGFYQ